jgi:lipid II:glycine glycyltransferase (peptidoglycan interpeptide bridge formation enzyme)
MGDDLKVRVAYLNGAPIASILTLRFKTTLVYKYGCADDRFFRLGGMQSLLWRAIEDAKQSGLKEVDLGRSDASNAGLINFKSRLGARRSTLRYFRFPAQAGTKSLSAIAAGHFEACLRFTPTPILVGGSSLLYKHFG